MKMDLVKNQSARKKAFLWFGHEKSVKITNLVTTNEKLKFDNQVVPHNKHSFSFLNMRLYICILTV